MSFAPVSYNSDGSTGLTKLHSRHLLLRRGGKRARSAAPIAAAGAHSLDRMPGASAPSRISGVRNFGNSGGVVSQGPLAGSGFGMVKSNHSAETGVSMGESPGAVDVVEPRVGLSIAPASVLKSHASGVRNSLVGSASSATMSRLLQDSIEDWGEKSLRGLVRRLALVCPAFASRFLTECPSHPIFWNRS